MSGDPATVPVPRPSRAWVFQANPQIYDLREALKHLTKLHWSVRQYQDEIRSGDRVYLWISGSDGGVVATGRILTDPQNVDETPEERRFYSNPDQVVREPRVLLRVTRQLTKPISRSVRAHHPILSNASIVRLPQATNFKLTKREALRSTRGRSCPWSPATALITGQPSCLRSAANTA
jgi:hypothetical protein